MRSTAPFAVHEVVIGSISGVTVAEKVYDWAFTPGECDQYVICGEE